MSSARQYARLAPVLIVALGILGCGDQPISAAPAEIVDVADTQTVLDIQFGRGGHTTSGDTGGSGDVPDADTTAVDTTAVDTTAVDTTAAETTAADAKVADAASGGENDAKSGDSQNDPADVDPADVDPAKLVKRVVLAGGSWAVGVAAPLRESMDAVGFGAVALSYQSTTHAGSQALGWIGNKHPPKTGGGQDMSKPKMLDALKKSLDADPPAALLVLVLGAGDYHRECADGYGKATLSGQTAAMDKIQEDIGDLVDEAIIGRPQLQVVLVGHDYLHFEVLKAAGQQLPGHTQESYNQGLVTLDARRLDVAGKRPQVHFANNLGVLQHTYGDKVHPPWPIPSADSSLPAYAAGVAPKPGGPPQYNPFAGGYLKYPAPLDVVPDGKLPTKPAFRTVIDNVMAQGLKGLMSGGAWPK